eukprot:12497881-Ditylum_brightwellii.AAC.1
MEEDKDKRPLMSHACLSPNPSRTSSANGTNLPQSSETAQVSYGQGATNAPPNWTLLANACQKAPGKMFVDDKNLMHNRKQPDSTAKELMTYVTHDVSLWDRYIWITGGLVERLKKKYSLMVWKFQTTRAPTITPGTELPENTV